MSQQSNSSLQMINEYLDSPISHIESNPLEYWKQHKYSVMAKLAKKYLSPPAGSVPSERMFSVTGPIVRPDRSRLDPERLNKLMIIKYCYLVYLSI